MTNPTICYAVARVRLTTEDLNQQGSTKSVSNTSTQNFFTPFVTNQMLRAGSHGENSFGHGWGNGGGSTFWRCSVENDGQQFAIVQVPPTSVNWEVDCTGDWRATHGTWGTFPGNPGQGIDAGARGTMPISLYETQLNQRLQPAGPSRLTVEAQ